MTNRHIIELAAALACVLALGACASLCEKQPAPAPKTVDTACTWAKPIQVSASDTPATKRAALGAWKTWDDNCGSQLKAEPLK
jgi:hypothetical protein